MSKKPIVLAIFCTCLATGTLLAANEVNLKTPPTPIQSVTPTNTQLTRVDINQADVDSLMTLHGLAQQKPRAAAAQPAGGFLHQQRLQIDRAQGHFRPVKHQLCC